MKSLPAELQQTAWRYTVEAHGSAQAPITAKEVQEAVKRVKAEQSLDTIREHLCADHVFAGIPFRLEFRIKQSYDKTRRKLLITDMQLPLRQQCIDEKAVASEQRQLVLVSPDVDLLKGEITLDDLNRLIQVCGSAPQFRFLLWSASPTLFTQVTDWPANIEVALRVSTEKGLERFAQYAVQIKPLTTIWATPTEPFQLAVQLQYKRCIIGTTMAKHDPDGQILHACAHTLATALLQSLRPTIHVAAHLLRRLAQSSGSTPDDGTGDEEVVCENEANFVP